MKKILLTLFTVLVITVNLTAQYSGNSGKLATIREGVLTVGMEIGYFPMEYYDEDGRTPIGFDVSLAKALGEKMGLKVEIMDVAWDGIFAGLQTNRYDCIISAVTLTEERALRFNFTKPYMINYQFLVVRKDSKVKPRSFDETSGLRLAYPSDTIYNYFFAEWLDKTGIKVNDYSYYYYLSDCFDDLEQNRIDVILAESIEAANFISKPGNLFEISGKINIGEMFAICIKKEKYSLAHAIDKALDELFGDGTMLKISNEVFGMDMVSEARN